MKYRTRRRTAAACSQFASSARSTASAVMRPELPNFTGLSAKVAVAAHEHLTVLHDAIQQAFNWENDHLYSFWLDGEF